MLFSTADVVCDTTSLSVWHYSGVVGTPDAAKAWWICCTAMCSPAGQTNISGRLLWCLPGVTRIPDGNHMAVGTHLHQKDSC